MIVEFGDFECPACRRFAATMRELRETFRDTVALVYMHFPLTSIHRFAMPVSRAAECASMQGRFAEFHDLLFEKQDSLGLKSWASYAAEAGVPDSIGFAECMEGRTTMPRTERGLELGKETGVIATPSLMINGWLFREGAFSLGGDEEIVGTGRAGIYVASTDTAGYQQLQVVPWPGTAARGDQRASR